jgi:hypothetical protein
MASRNSTIQTDLHVTVLADCVDRTTANASVMCFSFSILFPRSKTGMREKTRKITLIYTLTLEF